MVKPAERQAHESWAMRDEIICALGAVGGPETRSISTRLEMAEFSRLYPSIAVKSTT
jgi:hypothetical protein